MEDTYAYQLSFSNEAQRSPTKKASSPSLSNALSTNPDYVRDLTYHHIVYLTRLVCHSQFT